MKRIVQAFIMATGILLLPGRTLHAQSNGDLHPTSSLNKEAAYALIKRIAPKQAARFEVQYIPAEGAKDVFELESNNRIIVLKGNNAISVASAFNYYLKNYVHYDIGWNTALHHPIPDALPAVPQKVRKVSPYKYRYSFNYCTFNYTASWWDWDRWQRTIDWMAMNGINMPLALTGQNSVWDRVYKQLGFNEQEMNEFFTGPAYFNWFWMGNLDGWGGPLSQSFLQKHEALQKKILARERALGMKPILPAFTGHVPRSFSKHFPKAKLFKTSWGDDFPSVAFSYMLDPNDSLFGVIGQRFLEEQTRTFGTDHFYSADTFNEMLPPSKDSTFLNAVGRSIYQSMAATDPQGTWIMQGWMFSYHPDFWQAAQMKALLNAVPGNHVMILDLWSEVNPVWKHREAFYGKPWIWCMLHNFGGTNSLYGDLDQIGSWPAQTLQDPAAGNLAGIGLTMEALDQNPVVYALILENVWRDQPVDVKNWLKTYTHQRYGSKNAHAETAWEILHQTAYSGQPWWGTSSIITGRPTFKKEAKWTHTSLHYPPLALLPAWENLIKAAPALQQRDGFRYDLVSVARQVLGNYANHLQQQFAKAWQEKNSTAYHQYKNQFLALMDDLDRLLATREDLLLGKWINDAKKYGKDVAEQQLFEQNARDLITLWGDKDCGIHDYAWKHWAGLIKGYYKPRWQQFFHYVEQQQAAQQTFDEAAFEKKIKAWEWNWVQQHEPYSSKPVGDAVATAKALYSKYAASIKEGYGNSKKK